MTLLFQQQLLKGEKPLDSKCLWWGFDDGVFVLTDNHFHHWRITPCQRGLWPKEFPYELNKSSAKGDLSKTFAQLLGLRMPQLYSDIRFLAKMATFGTNNFPAPATIFKLNSLIVDPVFIHTSLRSSNSGEIVADPYVFLRTAKHMGTQLVTIQTAQGNICVYQWKGSEWKLRQNLCSDLMTFASLRQTDAKDDGMLDDIRLDTDIVDVTAELNFLRSVTHEWIEEDLGKAMLLSLQRNGQFIVWRPQQTKLQLKICQILTVPDQKFSALPTSFAFRSIEKNYGLLVVGYANGIITGHSISNGIDDKTMKVDLTVQLWSEVDNMSCSLALIVNSPMASDNYTIICAKNSYLLCCSLALDLLRNTLIPTTKFRQFSSGLECRLLQLFCRKNFLYAVDDGGYKIFRLESDEKKRIILVPMDKQLPNFSPSSKNAKLSGLAISPNNLVAVVFTRSAYINVRRNCSHAIDFRMNLPDEQTYWSFEPNEMKLCRMTDYFMICRYLLLTVQSSLDRTLLDSLIRTADGSPNLTTVSTEQLKVARLMCEFISMIRTSRDSDFERILTNQRHLIDQIIVARHIRTILDDRELNEELKKPTEEFTDKHYASLSCVAQFVKWYPLVNKEKIPLSTQWIQLVESKGSERTCGLALCPVCQSDEEWEIRPFSLRQFYCSTGHSVPRCSLTLLPVGAEGVSVVKCSFCGSFQWQSVSFLGILSHFHLCPICSYDGIPDVS